MFSHNVIHNIATAWIRLGSRAMFRKLIKDIGYLRCKCELVSDYDALIMSVAIAIPYFQSDTKGIPAVVLNQVLKRHSLALRYIKTQLLPTAQQLASSMDSSDEEENGQGRIERKCSADVEVSYEDGLPTSNFL